MKKTKVGAYRVYKDGELFRKNKAREAISIVCICEILFSILYVGLDERNLHMLRFMQNIPILKKLRQLLFIFEVLRCAPKARSKLVQ